MFTKSILEYLASTDLVSVDFLYECSGNPYKKARNFKYDYIPADILKLKREQDERIEKKQSRQRFLTMLAHLQRKGFVEKKDGKLVSITDRGLGWLQKYADKQKDPFRPIPQHAKREDEHLKVIIFDIPERDRDKRKWLRISLQNLGFALLQKSVWIGKTKLPEEFFQQVHDFELTPCVHIFAVQEQGSIGFDGNDAYNTTII